MTATATAAVAHLVGYHASAAGGAYRAVQNAVAAGAKAFAFFTRSSRTWTCPELKDADATKFVECCKQHGFAADAILPHGTYLSNSGSGDPSIREKSLAAIKDEMRRCARLGLTLYNFHPGSTAGLISREQCIRNVAAAIDECCAAVPGVVMVIETMAGGGGCVASSLEEIRDIIAAVTVDKARVGVCVDTAHVHAAGYDIRSAAGWNAFMTSFDATIGLRFLKGLHLNDSKVKLGSHVDRHESIGCGYIGIEGFRAIMNDRRTAGVPLILETPAGPDEKLHIQKYAKEIRLLYSLAGSHANDPVHAGNMPLASGATDDDAERDAESSSAAAKPSQSKAGRKTSKPNNSKSSKRKPAEPPAEAPSSSDAAPEAETAAPAAAPPKKAKKARVVKSAASA